MEENIKMEVENEEIVEVKEEVKETGLWEDTKTLVKKHGKKLLVIAGGIVIGGLMMSKRKKKKSEDASCDGECELIEVEFTPIESEAE
jgi:hypothetical protein